MLQTLPAGRLSAQDDNLFPVTVQLKWFHQFQFAGYYAAIERGFFREAGLDVTLIEGGPHINPTREVFDGNADFGIGTSGLLVTRSHGIPVVAVAAIFQHSPFILITRDDPDIRTVHDLEGRTIMVEPYSEELIAYLHHEGVDVDAINFVEHGGSPFDIYGGDIVGMTAYTTTEPYILQREGKTYKVFDPKVAGIDFYGDTLYTTEDFARNHNDRVVAFRDALIRGWRYGLRNQEELIELIKDRYQSQVVYDMLSFESGDIRRLLIPDLIEIGYMNTARWDHIAEQFRAAGMLESKVYMERFLFREDKGADWRWFLFMILIVALITLVFTLILVKFYSLNRSLKAEIQHRVALEAELKRLAITDYSTGVYNRRGFLELFERELKRTDRKATPLSLIELDLDHFKQINDTYGHAAGDKALLMVSSICRGIVRGIDIIGRMGGEEFMIILPETDSTGARSVAERILEKVAASSLELDDGGEVTVTVSIGIATRRPDEDMESFMHRADNAMYKAKERGRNMISTDEEMDPGTPAG